MFEDYYLDDPYMQRSLIDTGYYTTSDGPMTTEAETVSGIGSPAATAAATNPAATTATTTAATTNPAATSGAAAGTGLQVINANQYSPSDADLQAMNLTRDQWNEAMASLSQMDTKLLKNLSLDMVGKNPDATNNYRVFTAPISNKGNQTAYNNNSFTVIQDQPIRLVDNRTGQVVFQGTGYEAAEQAIALANQLTREGGNKAEWDIQTGQFKNPGSGDLVFGDTYKSVANEKANVSIIPEVLDILGDAALGFIIGGPVGAAIAAGASAAGVNVSDIAYPIIATAILAPTGFFAVAGAAALGSAVSSTVQGRSLEETLIRAGVTGLTAGLLEGTDIGGKVSDAIGGVLNDIGVESQVGNIISRATDVVSGIGGEAATQEILVTAATNAATAALAAGATGSAVSSAIVDTVKNIVPDYQPSPSTEAALNNVDQAAAEAADPTIVINGNVATGSLTGTNPIVGAVVGGVITPVGNDVTNPIADQPIEGEPVATVTGNPATPGAGIGGLAPVGTSTLSPTAPATTTTEPPPAEEEPPVATVTGNPATPGAGIGGLVPVGVGDPTSLLPDNFFDEPVPERSTLDTLRDAAEVVAAAATVGGVLADTVGGSTDSGTSTTDTSGLTLTTGTLRPTIPGGTGGTGGTGGIGGTGGGYPYTPQTYGRRGGDQETEYLFFTRDPITGQGSVQSGTPVTTTGTASTDPAMVAPSANTLAEGGEVDDDMVKHLVEYHKNGGHQGPGQVKGIGSGQDDKIPAWLSDGEYVWSAQDVADLGDGSTDEGVRRLDKMRQMVRRQAGRKDVKKIAKPQKGIDRMLKAVGGLA